jgi:hypothetical protein
MKQEEGWPPARLLPLLAGLRELVPLKQWHNDFDAALGTRLGSYYEGFCHRLGARVGIYSR